MLADLAVDGPATIRAYEAARVPVTTPASLVLDAAAVEAWPDGSTTERTHQVIHVHDARGVEKWGEVEVPAGATLLKLETRKRDGRILEPEAHGGDKRTLSAAGLEPGRLPGGGVAALPPDPPAGLAGLDLRPVLLPRRGPALLPLHLHGGRAGRRAAARRAEHARAAGGPRGRAGT